jgi:subtilase family serine protease
MSITGLLLVLSLSGWAEAAELREKHVPALARQMRPTGRVPAGQKLNLSLGLPLRNTDALTNLIQQIYNPASTNYHRFLTPAEFLEQFGPTESDYQSVIDFASQQGLRVSRLHPGRGLVSVVGAVSNIEQAFQITLQNYSHPSERRTFHAPDREPNPRSPVPILSVMGLDDAQLPRPAGLKAINLEPSSVNPNGTGSGPLGYFLGKDFRSAYAPNVTLDGSGQSVALVEFDGYFPADITRYLNLAKLSSVLVTNVLLDGVNGSASSNNIEVSLDIDMAICMAPSLSSVAVYEGLIPNNILYQMAIDNTAKQIGCSWSWSGYGGLLFMEQIFLQYAIQGQSFLCASGDSGAYTGLIDNPSDDPLITVVGGTTLTTSGGAWTSEKTWSWFPTASFASSGGISQTYAIPSWQQPVSMALNQGSTVARNIPDVALTADNIIIYADNGKAYGLGGTSAAAPLWAGFTALVNQQSTAAGGAPIGFLNPALYALGLGTNYNDTFHDITTGNNTNKTGGPLRYFATNGFDLCTGWGTPRGSALINALAPPSAPQIATQPTNQTINSGNNVTFQVTVTGTPPLTYQWLFQGSALPGAGTSTLLLTNAQSGQAGDYSVVVTNSLGSVTSSVATLTVILIPPQITSQPSPTAVVQGGTANFTVGVVGAAPLSFQWRAGETPITGATNNPLILSNVLTSQAAAYSVVITNTLGSVTSSVASLTVLVPPSVITPPVPATVVQGGTTNFSVNVGGTAPLAFQWRFGSTPLAGATNNPLVLTNIQASQAGAYAVAITNIAGSVTSSVANLTVLVPPQITNGPVAATVVQGGTTNFSVNVGGTAPLAFQWRFGATPLAGATNNPLVLTNLQSGQSGSYAVVITNIAGSVTSSVANLTVLVPPQITNGPVAATVVQGGTTNFSVNVGGTAPLAFQWWQGSYPLVGATNNPLVLTNIQSGQSGSYAVVITNIAGSVTSSVANLTVLVPPQITNGPVAATVVQGGTTNFSVNVGGTAPLAFQWWLGASPLVGATNNPLVLTNLQSGQSGSYAVVITNIAGSVTSSVANLTVLVPPQITNGPVAATVVQGGTTNFSVNVGGTAPLAFQWWLGSSPLVGATNDPLVLTNIQASQAGAYAVVITNIAGSVTSSVASLTVLIPPAISAAPTSQTYIAGSTVTFSITATGTAPLAYLWLKNGTNIGPASGPSLTLTNVTIADSGALIACQVTNLAESVTSSAAKLTVVPIPGDTAEVPLLPPWALIVLFGALAGIGVRSAGAGTADSPRR